MSPHPGPLSEAKPPLAGSTFDRVVRLASRLLDAPVSVISLVGPEKQVFASALGLKEPWATLMETPLTHSICQYVVSTDAPVHLDDAREDPVHQTSLSIPDMGLIAYLGVPLRDGRGVALGALCVIDYTPRVWTPSDLEILEDLSGIATAELERQHAQRELHLASREIARHTAMIGAFFNTAPLMMGVAELLPDDILHRLDNAATASFFGTTPEAMKDQRSSSLGTDPDTIARWLDAYRCAVDTGDAVRFDHVQQGVEGEQVLAVTVSHVGTSPAEHAICSYVCEDVTARRRIEAELRKSEQDLQLALTAGKMGAWKVDLVADDVVFSDEMYRLYQIERHQRTLDEAFEVVHELDRARLQAEFGTAIETAKTTGVAQEVASEYRVRVNEHVRWFRTVGRIYPGVLGTAIAMAGTALDVTAERLYNAALVEAREQAREAAQQAEAAARLRQSILHNMSHEIRTPLTAVIGYADLLVDESVGDNAEFAGYIKHASAQLLSTLNSVLDHARFEAKLGDDPDVEALSHERLNVSQAAESALGLFRQRAKDQGIDLRWEAPAEHAWGIADAGALQRVLTNLISNAVKFTEVGAVSVSVRRVEADAPEAAPTQTDPTQEAILVTISDTGRGMSEAFVAKAFEPFEQESDGMARSHEGTGLGLSIVHRLVEMMSGSITLTSTLGVGSVFEVRLPAADVGQPASL